MNCTSNGKKLCEAGFQIWFVANRDGKDGKHYSVPCPICNPVAYRTWESAKVKGPDGKDVPDPGIAIPELEPAVVANQQPKRHNQDRLFQEDAF
jgi:hypothetical protein